MKNKKKTTQKSIKLTVLIIILIQCHMLEPTFDGCTDKALVLIAGLRVIVLTTMLLRPSKELKDTVFLVSGFEDETVLFSVILDWSDVWLFWLCRGKNEEAKLAAGVFNDTWTVVVTTDDDGIVNIKDGDDNRDDITEADTWSVDCVGTNDEPLLDG